MATKRLPGLIDVHVHLRDPGATQKEDFDTGTMAALAGGYTFVLDMPNNPTPTISIERLEEKIKLADEKAHCDVGFNYGTDGKNMDTFKEAYNNPRVYGLKLYCNHTTGEMLVEDPKLQEAVFAAWDSEKPILVHAEGEQLAQTLAFAEKYDRRLHDCHISRADEVEMIKEAKKKGLRVSAGVCPHHLYMTGDHVQELGVRAMMKPPLWSKDDQAALWAGLADGTIDLVETDHAPHLEHEKESGDAKFGVPGLETSLGLMLKAVHDGKLSEEDVLRLMYEAPKRIFNIPDQDNTYVELDPEEEYVVQKPFQTKCNWSSFEGWTLYGKVKKVMLRSRDVYES